MTSEGKGVNALVVAPPGGGVRRGVTGRDAMIERERRSPSGRLSRFNAVIWWLRSIFPEEDGKQALVRTGSTWLVAARPLGADALVRVREARRERRRQGQKRRPQSKPSSDERVDVIGGGQAARLWGFPERAIWRYYYTVPELANWFMGISWFVDSFTVFRTGCC